MKFPPGHLLLRFGRGRIAAGLVIAVAVAVVLFLAARHLPFGEMLSRAELLRERIIAFGPAAPLAYIGVQIAQVIAAPIPGEVSGLVGGYLFGGWAAFFYSTVALGIGSVIAFFGGRLIAGTFPERIRSSGTYKKFNHLVSGNDFLLPLVLFVFPGFPKDSLSYVLGASDMDWRLFAVIATVGRMPGTLVLSFQGAQVYAQDWRGLFVFSLAAAVVFAPMFLLRHRLVAALGRKGGRP